MSKSIRGLAVTSLLAASALATPAFAAEESAPAPAAAEAADPIDLSERASDAFDVATVVRESAAVEPEQASLMVGDSGIEISGNIALVTDYRFRGVSFTAGEPAVQGGIDLAFPSGFYVGTWASSLEDSTDFGSLELDIYGGWSGDLTDGLALDVGLLYYAYPADDFNSSDADYFEPYASLGTAIGPFSATFGVAYAWEQESLADRDNLYLYADAEVGIPGTGLTLSGHLGYTDGVLSVDEDDTSFDYAIGISATVLGGLTVGVSYVGVEDDGVAPSARNNFTDDAIVGTLSYSF